MSRLTRKIAILAKIETTYGTDAVPTGAANAILISNQSVNPLNAQNVDRVTVKEYLGGAEQLVGVAYKEVSFDTELAGAGAAGTAPAYGVLLRGCGMAEAVSAGARVEYTPISATFEALTIYYYDDGVLHKLLGARGSFKLNMGLGNRPIISFRFIGIDGGDTAAANPSQTLTAWKTPLVITNPNTADLLLGCTYATAALSGGTAYPSKGIEIDSGVTVNHNALLGGETIELSDRNVSGKITLDLTAAQEVSFMTTVKANTTQSIGLQHGTTAGYKVIVYSPAVQLISPKKEEQNGIRLIGFDTRHVPLSGNDELRIVVF
ncbi:MAG TPA: hypothetical protein DCK83_00430 [Gallionellaceae bacterium]|nr:hypothetical protein [Gallionellaceae bacterium]